MNCGTLWHLNGERTFESLPRRSAKARFISIRGDPVFRTFFAYGKCEIAIEPVRLCFVRRANGLAYIHDDPIGLRRPELDAAEKVHNLDLRALGHTRPFL